MTNRLILDGDWQFRQLGGKTWYPATVPGCVHTDLLANRLIDDPMWRRNERDQFWIAEGDWEYRKRFPTPRDVDSGCRLVFEGLDTAAEITLNGRPLAKTCNMHRRYAFDVAKRLRRQASGAADVAPGARPLGPTRKGLGLREEAAGSGENELVIVFRSPLETARKLRKMDPKIMPHPFDRRFPFIEHKDTCRNFIRKAQYQFGWDWGMAQATSGVWREAYLETGGVWFDYLTASQTHRKRTVDLDVTLFFTADKAGRGSVAAVLSPLTPKRTGGQATRGTHGSAYESKSLRWKAGENCVTLKLGVSAPELWWPNGMGAHPLYSLEVTLLDESGKPIFARTKRIGFRTIELVRKPDAVGESFGFVVNGRPVYIKGANWVPVNTLPSAATDEQYRFLVESAAAAHMNCLRVWGGGIYEREIFYDLCDELGVMVWQDHLFACSPHTAVKPFTDEIEPEITHNVRRLQSHPSLALWCGDNENQVAIEWWWRDEKEVKHIRKSYYRLMEGVVRRVTEREDPSRPFWLSSPSNGPGRRKKPGDLRFGDVHLWEAWFGNTPFSGYLKTRPRFVSEFGFLSFAHGHTFESVTEPRDRNVASPVMEHHQRMVNGNARIIERLLQSFRMPKDFDSTCYVTQLVQAMGIGMAVEHWRRIKPHCQGTLYWQLNETWPEACNSSIDGRFQWKAFHYAAKRFYAPVLASINPTDPDDPLSPVEVWITSDEMKPVEGRWTVELVALDGKRKRLASKGLSLKANESRSFATLEPRRFLGDSKPDEHILLLAMKAGKHAVESLWFFGAPKYLDLPKAKLKVKVTGDEKKGFSVTVSSDSPALFVELYSRNVPGVFSDNYVHLLDRRPRAFTFTPRCDASGATLARFRRGLRVRSLADTY